MKLEYNQQKLARVAKRFKLKFVIAHGSFATGKNRRDSDLDIAVLGYRPIAFNVQLQLFAKLAEIFGNSPKRELDLKTLHRVDPLFRYEVVRDGRLLCGDPTDYEEFKAFTEHAYRDAEPLRELEKKLSRKFQKYLNKITAAYA